MPRRIFPSLIMILLIFSSTCWAQTGDANQPGAAGSSSYDNPSSSFAVATTRLTEPAAIFNVNNYRNSCDDGSSCGPFTARVGVVFLTRESPDDTTLVLNNAGNGPEVLRGGDFDFDYEAGIDVSLIFNHPNRPYRGGSAFSDGQ